MVTTMKEINQFFERRQVQLGMNFGLSRMETLLTNLGDPHKALKYIHIAGSNGKGSTLQYMKEILLAEGVRVASFTSPYLIRLNEQLKINADEISDKDFIATFRELQPFIQEMDSKGNGPTQFEILTAMAFSYFSKKEVDLVLMETGLGGRLDTTNVIQPFLSIITSISLEHTNILGSTLGEIASEKAGIIKSGAPIISGVTAWEPAKVIEEKASSVGVPYYQLGKDFHVVNVKQSECGQSFSFSLGDRSIENVEMQMLGRHQMENAALAIAAVLLGMENIDEKSILKGIGEAKWDGRFEKISDEPLVIIDGAHNPAGIDVLMETLKVHYPEYKYRFIFSSFKDKNYSQMLRGLETEAMEIIITEFFHERAADAHTLYEKCSHENKSINKDWQAAIREGRRKTGGKEALVITGSLHFLSLVREFLIREDA
ncbi:bifunctional folylpolyglutamate synthase/dihydrofolate synthase [Peribacillus simplex]|uniref:tetrahydrofolate synthase n=1 Tax=Peribacillus simplex TaxID=1478 RepID=A0AAW7ILJ9_9BACI|nr:folylpolyglutamate synthase/dihydrofolate synthase family protein [Peribacillus simplex]MDM5452627.1 folylpolyglutamate synthase/dihydrofolate synthase family protein [Peribacillus simplex]